jgi:hypothetical protein
MRSKASAMTDEPTAPTEAETETAANTGAPVAPETASGSDVPPDRLAINPRSPHFDADKLQRGIGIRFKDAVRTNVEEYSISEGWIKVQAGKTKDRNGQPLTIKLSGPVEAWYEDLGEDAPVAKKG